MIMACRSLERSRVTGTCTIFLSRNAVGIVRLSLFPKMQKAQRRSDIDRTLEKIRGRYGYHSIRRAIALVDPALDLDAKEEHIIHPIGFLGTLHE